MGVFKKIIALGLFLLAFCLLVETTGFCKFAKMFPTQREKDILPEDKGRNKTSNNNNKTATNIGKTFAENITTTGGETSPVRYKSSPQAVTDHLLEDTTAVTTDEHSTTSPATVQGATTPEKTETSNSKPATTVGKTFTEHVTATGGKTSKTYKTSPQAITDHLVEDTTAVTTDELCYTVEGESSSSKQCFGYFNVSGAFFSSPNFPSNYGYNEDCSYVIEAPAGQVILLSFSSFSVESNPTCVFDAVKVYEGKSPCGTFLALLCGSTIQDAVYTSGNQMFVSFTTDVSVTHSGFNATVTFVDESNLPKIDRRACGDTWTGDIGVLTSPNWPNRYESNVECEYFIQGSSGQTVSLSFDHFEVGTSPCQSDYVEIHDGASSSSTLLAKLCGKNLPGTYTSSGSDLYVKFYSDGSTTQGGFSASYTLK